MRISDLLTMSINNLRRRKLRTVLTVLGVIIGTASIVVMVSLGIGLKEMTVEENVMTGAFLHTRSTRAARASAGEILEMVGMSGKRDILGGSLTIVDKKRLEIARALATKPKLLMLDECMAGLNQTEIKDVMNLCLKLRENGLSLLIVEHIMEAIMPISDRIVVLNAGKKIAEGVPKEIADNDEVIKAYLGDRYHAKSRKS